MVPAAYYLGAVLGVLFTTMPEGTAVLWPANSVLLSALLLLRGRGLLPLALLTIAAELLADAPFFTLQESLLFGVVNVFEATLAFALLKRANFDVRFATLADLRKFLLAGPVVAAASAAVAGAAIYAHFRGGETAYLQFVRVWWFGDALGLLVFTPLILGLAEAADHIVERLHRLQPADWLLLALVAAALAIFVGTRDAEIFGVPLTVSLLLPFAIAVASRFGLAIAAGTAAAMSLAVVVKTTIGHSPFPGADAHEAVLHAQEFVLVLAAVTIGPAALLAQLRTQQRDVELTRARLEEANARLEARVREKTRELEALNRDLSRIAFVDALTGIANRRAFVENASREFDNSRRYGTQLSLLLLDLDHFKSINDRYGHAVGDLVLQQVALAIVEALRAGDTVARYGGEEFVVLTPHTGLRDAVVIAARIRSKIARCGVAVQDATVRVTASIGAASRSDGDENLDALLGRADRALYRAKHAGRDRIELADEDVSA